MLIMLFLWALGLRQRNFSYVDLGWSANFAVLALIYGLLGNGDPTRRLLICGMYALWGVRLALHLAARIVGEPEEGRYAQLRTQWGATGSVPLKFLGFFQLQALLNIVLGMPMLLAAVNPTAGLHALEVAGLGVWTLALVGESVADHQLKAFKRDASGRGGEGAVCDVGLWGWSRHPNYFFEWIIWIGYALFALASPHGWLALGAPALMLYFLLNVTGKKLLEKRMTRARPDYAAYVARTPGFFPWFPRGS